MPFLAPALTSVVTWVSTTLAAGGLCPSSEFFGMLRCFRNGGSGSVSV
jgi:hypothetical protein